MPRAPHLLPALGLTLALAGCASAAAGPSPAVPPGESSDVSALELREGENFEVFTGDGREGSLDALLQRAAGVDILLLGEEHDDPLTHRLQLEILREAFVRYGSSGRAVPPGHGVRQAPPRGGRTIVLSLEMFERDVQGVVDEYLAGLITEAHLADARPWRNYQTDYRPLVEFARVHGIPVVASNAPRRYVNRASRLGRDSLTTLSPRALETLAPLPYPGASNLYRAQWDSLMGDAASHMGGSALDAQTLWDATMAYSVTQALERWPGALVIHLAGSFHVERGTGIPEALRHYSPESRAVSVVFKPEEGSLIFQRARDQGYGDYVVLTRAGGG